MQRITHFAAALVLLLVLSACYSSSHPPRIGSTAPDFTVQDAQTKVTLSNFRGQVVVLNFWATRCPPSIEEKPSLVEMQRRMKAKGVSVIAVILERVCADAGICGVLAGQTAVFAAARFTSIA